jgi:FKBP-type peptidyl-prolyl cis-trans isomerase
MRSLIIFLFVFVTSVSYSFDVHGQTRRSRASNRRAAKSPATQPKLSAAAMTTRTGLTYLITHRGTGRLPAAGETVLVHYTGVLSNGVKFDSSRDRNEPIAFKLGTGRVIKGWDEGIAKLHVGDQAILVIPSSLGYGKKGVGDGLIPPDATLIFIVELVDVKATSLTEVLSQTLEQKGMDAAVAQYHELRAKGAQDFYTSESDMNGWGYRLLLKQRLKEAVEVFKLNVAAYPQSANVYDSLAEAYLASGDRQLAIENYQKALELNPQLESAQKALKELTGK